MAGSRRLCWWLRVFGGPGFHRRPERAESCADRASGDPGWVRRPFVRALAEPGDKGEGLAVVRETQRVQNVLAPAFEKAFGNGSDGFARNGGECRRRRNRFGVNHRVPFLSNICSSYYLYTSNLI